MPPGRALSLDTALAAGHSHAYVYMLDLFILSWAIRSHSTTKSPKATRRAVVTTTNHSLFQIWISFRLSAYVYSVVLPAAGFGSLLSTGREISLVHRTDFIPELLWIHLCRMACGLRHVRVFFRGLSPDRFLPSSILIIHERIRNWNSEFNYILKIFFIYLSR